MLVPYTRISLLSARHLWGSYTEQVGCTWRVNKWSSSVRGTHVRSLFWLPMSSMSSSKTIISSIFAGHVSSPYSIQMDSKSRANTQISRFAASYV